jgi:hypothetical protein
MISRGNSVGQEPTVSSHEGVVYLHELEAKECLNTSRF